MTCIIQSTTEHIIHILPLLDIDFHCHMESARNVNESNDTKCQQRFYLSSTPFPTPNTCTINTTKKRAMQRRKDRKESFRTSFSSLLVLIGVLLMVSLMSVAANACSGSTTNPPTSDPLPYGNREQRAAERRGSLGGVVDDLFQNYVNVYEPDMDIGLNVRTDDQRRLEGSDKMPDGCLGKWMDRSCYPKKAVDDWIAGGSAKDNVVATYGFIQNWDMSEVTDMSRLFLAKKTFNSDISKWITSSCLTMERSTYKVVHFNLSPCCFSL